MTSSKIDDYRIRPVMDSADIVFRGCDFKPKRLKAIKKSLRTLDNLELMATTIYAFQITKKDSELNRWLLAAICNEASHYQDFLVKLYEYGFRPFKLRSIFWLVGFILGFGSRLLGRKTILKTGIWAERKAVHHYQTLLDTIDWDEDTRKVIEKKSE